MPEDLPTRKGLPHDIPHWVEDGSLFFITVNCAERGRAQLTLRETSQALLEAARFYHEQHRWHITLLLLMPDHFHALMGFPRGSVIRDLFRDWKRYTSRKLGLVWQDGFFDHRLRNDHEAVSKHLYILNNPVRAGLCQNSEEWPHQMRWTSAGLVIGG